MYTPLTIELMEPVSGVSASLEAMRLPLGSKSKSFEGDLALAGRLIKRGDDHAKAMRGIIAYVKMELQVGWMIELETYRAGVECLSTSSTMHQDLKGMKGPVLAELKQSHLPNKVYTRIATFSYQALRSIYKARRNHRHPDWQVFCDFVEGLPYFNTLIYPEHDANFSTDPQLI